MAGSPRPRGESQWLTCEQARNDAQKIRARSDAIIVGAGTLRADDPQLTLRGAGLRRKDKCQPWRVVLTRSGDLPASARIFTDALRDRTLVFKKRSLKFVLLELASKRDVTTAMIEGGGQLLAQAFRDDLVDEVCFYFAPIISGSGKPVIDPKCYRGESKAIQNLRTRMIGNCIRVSGLLQSPGPED